MESPTPEGNKNDRWVAQMNKGDLSLPRVRSGEDSETTGHMPHGNCVYVILLHISVTDSSAEP